MKLKSSKNHVDIDWSRPARGAWIEIVVCHPKRQDGKSRAPQGARGLKFIAIDNARTGAEVAPRKGRVD